jgi:hypothetical protein
MQTELKLLSEAKEKQRSQFDQELLRQAQISDQRLIERRIESNRPQFQMNSQQGQGVDIKDITRKFRDEIGARTAPALQPDPSFNSTEVHKKAISFMNSHFTPIKSSTSLDFNPFVTHPTNESSRPREEFRIVPPQQINVPPTLLYSSSNPSRPIPWYQNPLMTDSNGRHLPWSMPSSTDLKSKKTSKEPKLNTRTDQNPPSKPTSTKLKDPLEFSSKPPSESVSLRWIDPLNSFGKSKGFPKSEYRELDLTRLPLLPIPPDPITWNVPPPPTTQSGPCIACKQNHDHGLCPLRNVEISRCPGCGFHHLHLNRCCPLLRDVEFVKAMKDRLKESAEDEAVVHAAKLYLNSVYGDHKWREKQKRGPSKAVEEES